MKTKLQPVPQAAKKKSLWRFLPLLLIVTCLLLFYFLKGYDYLSFAMLQHYDHLLVAWNQQHALLTALAFILLYTVTTAISLPTGTVLAIAAGFIFTAILGTLYTVIAATLGAFILFLAVKIALRDFVHRKAGKKIQALEQGLHKDEFSYLLFLRLVPIFPFWLVNIVPALFGVSMRNYLLTTFLGIIPGTYLQVLLGSEAGDALGNAQAFSWSMFLAPKMLATLAALLLLSIIPFIYKRVKRKQPGC